jgi:hypothetical protein
MTFRDWKSKAWSFHNFTSISHAWHTHWHACVVAWKTLMDLQLSRDYYRPI